MWTLTTKEIVTGSRSLSKTVEVVAPRSIAPGRLVVFQYPLQLPRNDSAQEKTTFSWKAKTKKMKTAIKSQSVMKCQMV